MNNDSSSLHSNNNTLTPEAANARPSVTSVEVLKQELYETQLQLRTKTDFVTVLQNDVEQLHFVEDENTNLKSELTSKDSDLKQWMIKHSNLEFKLSEQQKDHSLEIDSLKEQINILKRAQDKPLTSRDVPIVFNETIITELKTELENKKDKHGELQIIIKDQEIMITELTNLKNKSIEELEEFKILVGCKTDQLNEWKQKYESVQEECEMLRLQVNSMNSLNNHNKRGNSLFAEVDDKRQALTAELELKREKYEALKKLLSKANHSNNEMKMEIMRLEKKLLDTDKNDDLEKSTLIQSYKNRISDLEAKIRDLEKRPDAPLVQIDNLNNEGMNVVLQIISDVRNEKKALEEEMNRRSVRDMEARQQCFRGECEIRQLKKEMKRDKLLLKELEQQISVLKSKEAVNKENRTEVKHVSKGVRFHENSKIEDGGTLVKQVKNVPQPSVLNTIFCPKVEDF